ncbi:unnamed protein product [Dibothriocephalus latus]|uniref:D-2-hydroxyglutarate dehydrogenase, mitochondrial n=1 Tax=Dibothriocephalus latus TaxID=60516 RepID=A0A3P6SHZ3_DIBLA|nr:unnamed protein product [Dibothriocephalus latus]
MRLAKYELAETLSAFEYLNHDALRVVQRELKLDLPITLPNDDSLCSKRKAHAVLVEASSINEGYAAKLMNAFTAKAKNTDLCHTGVISANLRQTEKLWELRKNVIDACKQTGPFYKFDLQVPAKQLPELVRLLESICSGERASRNPSIRRLPDSDNMTRLRDLVIFGQLSSVRKAIRFTHCGLKASSMDSRQRIIPTCVVRIESILAKWLAMGRCGKFLGFCRNSEGTETRGIHRLDIDEYGLQSNAARELQLALKKAWDPKGIMNPYKTWPFISN